MLKEREQMEFVSGNILNRDILNGDVLNRDSLKGDNLNRNVLNRDSLNGDILYEDKEIIVCRKMAGIAVQTARIGEADMESALKNYLRTSYIGIVHRLDQLVEVILVFGKTKDAAAALSRQSRERMMNKEYYAAVAAAKPVPVKEKCTLVDYLKKDGKGNISRVTCPDEKDAKRAELSYEVIGTAAGQEQDMEISIALVRVCLKTGRHHQIRVQMANAGMPILGDNKYGSRESKAYSSENHVKNIALCAYGLEFAHPRTGKKMNFQIVPSGEGFRCFAS